MKGRNDCKCRFITDGKRRRDPDGTTSKISPWKIIWIFSGITPVISISVWTVGLLIARSRRICLLRARSQEGPTLVFNAVSSWTGEHFPSGPSSTCLHLYKNEQPILHWGVGHLLPFLGRFPEENLVYQWDDASTHSNRGNKAWLADDLNKHSKQANLFSWL